MTNPDISDPGVRSVPVAIYTRVSTHKQLGLRFESCESQAAVCRDYIQRRIAEGWVEVASFSDPAYSGGSMKRPGMEALKQQVAAGNVKVVLIFKLERVLRSTDEWAPFRSFLQAHGCRLEGAMEDLSEKTPLGRLQNNLRVSVAEYERLNTAEKVRVKMQEQAKRGIWNGGYIPYGYAYDEKAQMLTPDPKEAPIVCRIYEAAAARRSLTELANTLNAEGVRTKDRTIRRRDGTIQNVGAQLFRSDNLRTLIRSPIYRGAVRFAGEEYAGRHAPLVSAELWEQANAAVAHPQIRPVDLANRERDIHQHLLKNLTWCGHCGRAFIPHASGKKNPEGKPYRYYHCGAVLRRRAPDDCAIGRLSADALEAAVIRFLAQVGRHPALIAAVLAAARKRTKTDRTVLRHQVAEAEAVLGQVRQELRHCVDAVARGGLEILGEELGHRANELRIQQQRLSVRLEQARQQLAACDAATFDEQRIAEALGDLGTLLERLEPIERKELLRLFIERIEIRSVSSPRHTARDDSYSPRRLLALRIQLQLRQLVQGVEATREQARQLPPVSLPGLSFEPRIDFTDTTNGQVVIVAPFHHAFRIKNRTLNPAPPEETDEHAIVRAQNWQRLLATGKVRNRLALAKRYNLSWTAVAQIMRLTELTPDIQAYLTTLKTSREIRFFSVKRVGQLAHLPAAEQRAAFERLKTLRAE